MTDPPAEGIPLPDQDLPESHVAENLACGRCGYNLRTLSTAGICPECGTPIEYTLHGRFLKNSHPTWVRRVARGVLLSIITAVLVTTGAIGVAIWAITEVFASGGFAQGAPPRFDLHRIMAVTGLAYLPLNVLAIVSIVLLTTPEPGDAQPRHDGSTRAWLRRSLWLYGGSVILGAFIALTPTRFIPPDLLSSLIAAQAPAGIAIYFVMSLLTFRYFCQLMGRVPRPGLVTFGRVVFWGVLICGVLVTIGQVLSTGQRVQTLTQMQTPVPGPITADGDGTGSAPPAILRSADSSDANPLAATNPFVPPGANLPRPAPGALAAQAIGGCGSCVFLGFGIAGFVLTIMVCSALYGAARQAEQIAGLPPQPAQTPPSPTS
jgi:hypothetical protein